MCYVLSFEHERRVPEKRIECMSHRAKKMIDGKAESKRNRVPDLPIDYAFPCFSTLSAAQGDIGRETTSTMTLQTLASNVYPESPKCQKNLFCHSNWADKSNIHRLCKSPSEDWAS